MPIYQGEDTTIFATITDQSGAAEDLTGLTGSQITYYLGRAGAEQQVTLTIGAGITITDAPAGEIAIALTAAQTSLKPGRWRQEVWITKSSKRRLAVFGDVQLVDTLEVIG